MRYETIQQNSHIGLSPALQGGRATLNSQLGKSRNRYTSAGHCILFDKCLFHKGANKLSGVEGRCPKH